VETTWAGWVESNSAAGPSTSITDTIEVWDTTATTVHVGRLSKCIRDGCAITADTSKISLESIPQTAHCRHN
jgi:hypothetical protein